MMAASLLSGGHEPEVCRRQDNVDFLRSGASVPQSLEHELRVHGESTQGGPSAQLPTHKHSGHQTVTSGW
jgi:hypothetical protein